MHSRTPTLSEAYRLLQESVGRNPHLAADLGIMSREEAQSLDPTGPIRIVDYLDILKPAKNTVEDINDSVSQETT